MAVLVLHLLTTIARLAGPGGARSVVAESVLLKHQLLILNRTRRRAPNLRVTDRVVAGSCALPMPPTRLVRSRWRPVGGRRIRAPQAPVADPQSDAETGAKSPRYRSRRRWLLCASHAPDAAGPFRDRFKARHALAPSSSAEDAEIPPAVLAD